MGLRGTYWGHGRICHTRLFLAGLDCPIALLVDVPREKELGRWRGAVLNDVLGCLRIGCVWTDKYRRTIMDYHVRRTFNVQKLLNIVLQHASDPNTFQHLLFQRPRVTK